MKECLSAASAFGLSALLSVSLASEAVAQDAMEEKETAAEEMAPPRGKCSKGWWRLKRWW